MKNIFNAAVIVLAMVFSFLVYEFILGNPGNFKDAARHEPKAGNVAGTIYTGGPLVAVLMGLTIIAITYVIERQLSINKAKGKGDPAAFIKRIQAHLEQGDIDGALAECDQQRGSIANIVRAGLSRYQQVENDPQYDPEKKLAEVQRSIDEATNLETPLLEKNLVMLSTVASTSTMIGLLGTTLGMIRAFAALGAGGSVSAQQLSVGISEALYNTAGGLIAAIISIFAFNFFTTKVDNFVYMIDEAILSVMEILTVKVKK